MNECYLVLEWSHLSGSGRHGTTSLAYLLGWRYHWFLSRLVTHWLLGDGESSTWVKICRLARIEFPRGRARAVSAALQWNKIPWPLPTLLVIAWLLLTGWWSCALWDLRVHLGLVHFSRYWEGLKGIEVDKIPWKSTSLNPLKSNSNPPGEGSNRISP